MPPDLLMWLLSLYLDKKRTKVKSLFQLKAFGHILVENQAEGRIKCFLSGVVYSSSVWLRLSFCNLSLLVCLKISLGKTGGEDWTFKPEVEMMGWRGRTPRINSVHLSKELCSRRRSWLDLCDSRNRPKTRCWKFLGSSFSLWVRRIPLPVRAV